MKLRSLIAGSALCLAISAVAAGQAMPAPAEETVRLVDLTDEFDAFWERSQGQTPIERAASLRAEFASLIPGFYGPARFSLADSAVYDIRIGTLLQDYPAQRDGVREVSLSFAALFAAARRSFEAEFGGFRRPQTVYLVHSLGEMDGGTRQLPGGLFLIFGADVMARLHLSHRIQPFFHHELFHLHHADAFADCGETVWCDLWQEGLATHVAARLNPGATDSELLLEVPEPIRAPVEANRAEAVCAVRARLDSGGRADRQALFSFRRMNERLPPRFGYYVGYLVAAELGRTRSLRALARLRPARARPLIEAALDRLAACPAA